MLELPFSVVDGVVLDSLRAGDEAALVRCLADGEVASFIPVIPHPYGMSEAEAWIADLSRPGALEAALNIYRANSRPETYVAPPPEYPPIDLPVMGVWSSKDRALVEEQMVQSERHVAGPWRYERLEGVGHWIPLEAPELLNPLLLGWLAEHR